MKSQNKTNFEHAPCSMLHVSCHDSGWKGFSLIELIVTISISMVITAVVFFNYPSFNANLSIRRTADEIALSVREAQAYGLGVREFKGFSVIGKFPGYGVHFDINSPKNFILYADGGIDGSQNNQYDKGAGIGCGGQEETECFRDYGLATQDVLVELCGDSDCSLANLDIVFLRPNPTVIIRSDSAPGNFSQSSIRVRAMGGEERVIKITAAGQISVEKP